MDDMEKESAKKIKLSIGSPHGKRSESEGSTAELDGIGSAQLVLRGPDLPRPPEEAVFAIDHILESMFSGLDRRKLLNCRLVSSRWGSCASQQLRKTLTIRFGDCLKNEPNNFYLLNGRSERSLEDFIDLMNNSTNFPSTSFSFRNKYDFRTRMKICLLITPFLNAHGSTITKICIEENAIWSSDLWRLLSTQAPNLECLALSGVYDQTCQSNSFGDKQVDGPISFDFKKKFCGEARIILKYLRVFKCQLISDFTLALLLSCAPNLVEIYVPFESLPVLLKPTNRLCLVKELHVNWPNVEGTESLSQIAGHHENDLLLKKLIFEDFEGLSSENGYSNGATFMCKILNASSDTLEHLTWKGITGEYTAPQMPRVKCLNISYSNRFNHSLKLTRVPFSVSLGQTYPNLKSLFLSTVHRDDERREICFTYFFRDTIPVLSVTNVTIYFFPAERFLKQLREMLPNACFSIFNRFNGSRLYELFPPRANLFFPPSI